MTLSNVAKATAKVALAFTFAGPLAGLYEVTTQLVDLADKRSRRESAGYQRALERVEQILVTVGKEDRVDEEGQRLALEATQDLFRLHALTASELAGLGFEEGRAAAELLHRGERTLQSAGLDADTERVCRRAVLECYRGMLGEPGLLSGREDAFQREVLARLPMPSEKSGHAVSPTFRVASPTPLIVGRIPAMAEGFQDRAGLQAVGSGHTIVLMGLGGVGKTQLAAAYAREQLQLGNLDLLIWASASSVRTVMSAYLTALRATQPGYTFSPDPEFDAATWLSWLEVTDRRWLIILDDVADPRHLRGLWPTGPTGKVVVTTRRQDTAFAESGRSVITVGVFGAAESASYLTHKLREDQLREAEALAEDLGHLPLALAQATAVIANDAITCAAYRLLLADKRRLLDEMFPTDAMADDYGLTVATTWLISIEAADALNPTGLARRVLRLCALLDSHGIPAQVLFAETIRAYLSDSEQTVEASVTEPHLIADTDIHRALQNLRRVSLISMDPASNQLTSGQSIRVHRLVQRVSRESAANQVASDAIACAEMLIHVWPDADFRAQHEEFASSLALNTEALFMHAGGAIWATPVGIQLINRVGGNLLDRGLKQQAVAFWSAAVDQAIKNLGPQHPYTLAAQGGLGGALKISGATEQAVEILEQTHADSRAMLGADSEGTFVAANNLASAYRACGRLEQAIELFERTLQTWQSVAPRDIQTLHLRDNLAGAYEAAGRLDLSIPLFELNLSDYRQALGSDHLDTLVCANNLAHAYLIDGQYEYALACCHINIEVCRRVLAPHHPTLVLCRRNLADAYRGAGQIERAITLYEENRDYYVQTYGPTDLTTVREMDALAGAHQVAGHFDAAIDLFTHVVPEFERQLRLGDPELMDARDNLAGAYLGAGRPTEAIPLLERSLKERITTDGQTHSATLNATFNLAKALVDANIPTQALPLLEKLVSIYWDRYGQTADLALKVRNELGITYVHANRLAEAIEVLNELLKDCRHALGATDPRTATVRSNLAEAYQKAGRIQEAATLFAESLERSSPPQQPTQRRGKAHPHKRPPKR